MNCRMPVIRIVLHEGNFAFLVGLTFLGALIGHGSSRSIYGIEGAKSNPKSPWIVRWYQILFAVKKNPGKPPETIEDLWEKLDHSFEWFEGLSTTQKVLISAYRFIRLAIVSPTRIVFLGIALLTTWILAIEAIKGSLQPLGGLLLIAQLVFFFGSWVFNRFPSAVPVDPAPWIFLAEYHKAEHLHERDDIEFEYGPLNLVQSAREEFEEVQRDPRNQSRYDNKEDIDWTVPLEEPEPEYLVKLDENSEREKKG